MQLHISHSGPAGSRVGTVYKNLPLKITETRGDWVKVEIDAWFPKNSISKKKKRAGKASRAAAAAAAAAKGSTALTLDGFSVQRRGGL